VAALSGPAEHAAEAGGRKGVDEFDLPALISHRESFLTDYQNGSYAARYRDFVDEVRRVEQSRVPGSTELAFAVAESLAKLMSYKDEYEVARLYTGGEFEQDLKSRFAGSYRLEFSLAPPIFARRDRTTGELKKQSYGPWIFSVFKVLARLRRLRGTMFDPFGHSAERRGERALIEEYRQTIAHLLKDLAPANHATAVAIASLPKGIRGYGHIKEKAIHEARDKQAQLLEEYRGTAYPAAAE
jgi:indolepyruvate ferredoxin oxidoreductase